MYKYPNSIYNICPLSVCRNSKFLVPHLGGDMNRGPYHSAN